MTAAGLGAPAEYPHWLALEGPVTTDRYRALWDEHPIFGVKVGVEDGRYGISLDDLLPPGRRVYVWHTRDDKTAQAESYAVAMKYGCWFEPRPAEAEVPVELVEWSRLEIHRLEVAWLRWFMRRGVVPVCTSYEECRRGMDGVVARVASVLDAKMPAPTSPIAASAPRLPHTGLEASA